MNFATVFSIALGVALGLKMFYKIRETWQEEEDLRNYFRCGWDKVKR